MSVKYRYTHIKSIPQLYFHLAYCQYIWFDRLFSTYSSYDFVLVSLKIEYKSVYLNNTTA
jgi:hypothetical protein